MNDDLLQINTYIAKCMQEVGPRIAHRRSQMGLTQKDLAELSGVTPQFLSCVEINKKNIRAENLLRLSITMGVSTDYLLTGQRTREDLNKIIMLLERLDETQIRYAEDIIKSFVLACTKSTYRHLPSKPK